MDKKDETYDGKWSLHQIVGGNEGEEVPEEDVITALAFDSSGKYLAVGDNDGRLIVFEQTINTDGKTIYKFLSEQIAHRESFDVLKSETILPKITDIKFVRSDSKSMLVASCTAKMINISKIAFQSSKRFQTFNCEAGKPGDLKMPLLTGSTEPEWTTSIKRTFLKKHSHEINSLSLSAAKQSLVASDDCLICLYDVEKADYAMPMLELSQLGMEDDAEVITSSQIHPSKDGPLVFSTNKGVRTCDLRASTNVRKGITYFTEPPSTAKKNIFTDFLACVSNATFSNEGNLIYARGLLSMKIWDVRITNKPVEIVPLFDPVKSKLAEMYEDDSVFDRFMTSSSPCGTKVVTGFYDKTIHIVGSKGGRNEQLKFGYDRSFRSREILKGHSEKLGADFSHQYKSIRTVWHPNKNLIASAFESSIFIFSQDN